MLFIRVLVWHCVPMEGNWAVYGVQTNRWSALRLGTWNPLALSSSVYIVLQLPHQFSGVMKHLNAPRLQSVNNLIESCILVNNVTDVCHLGHAICSSASWCARRRPTWQASYQLFRARWFTGSGLNFYSKDNLLPITYGRDGHFRSFPPSVTWICEPRELPCTNLKCNYTNQIFYTSSKIRGRDSSVDIATGYGLDGPGIESWWEQDFSYTSRPALGYTQPPVQWVPGLFQG
jgi:hypothetical protein